MSYTIGVAMIARNGGKMMRKALKPFVGQVDEIAVVFGGRSTDNTEQIARKIATKTAHFDSELDDDGRLLDFASARQQAFDLCATDWCIVVDCDDAWQGVENVRTVIDRAHNQNAYSVWVAYSLSRSEFHQPRIFRRKAGRWSGKVHEQFVVSDDWKAEGEYQSIKTGFVRIRQQERPDTMNDDRLKQNIAIGEAELADDPTNYRAAAQLCNDYLVTGEYQQALSITNHYLETWAADPERQYDSDLAHVWSRRGLAQINIGDYASAALSELWALGTYERGGCWTYLGEALLKMGMDIAERSEHQVSSKALFDLTIFAADKALEVGRSRSGYADDVTLTTYKPMAIKAMALLGKNQPQRALRQLDLGLAINPTDEMLNDLQVKVAESVGEII